MTVSMSQAAISSSSSRWVNMSASQPLGTPSGARPGSI
jgi:hypothetical protein